MGQKGKTLLLVTAQYPFGFESEQFLVAEMKILCTRFEQIILFPRRIDSKCKRREIPPNAEVSMLLCSGTKNRPKRFRPILLMRTFWLYLRCLILEGNWTYLRHWKFFSSRIYREICASEILIEFLRSRRISSATAYNYWAFGNALSIGLLRKKKIIARAICRCHGYDLYDERWSLGIVPFRRMVSNFFDAILPISEFGSKYLRERLSDANSHKVKTSYLGIENSSISTPLIPGFDSHLVVSCSSLVPLKRVSLIPRLLASAGLPIRWVHFGEGETRAEIESVVQGLPPSIRCELRGQVGNSEILRFYRESAITCFLSLSSSEGLPFSMIEAISCGIPVVACKVGGVAEIVNEKTGILLEEQMNLEEWTIAFRKILTGETVFDREGIIRFQKERFFAEKNYEKFVNEYLL